MDTAVADAPAAAVKPTSAAESALLAAWEVAPDRALECADRLAAAASDRLDREETTLATTGRFSELRDRLVQAQTMAALNHFVQALANGEEPEPLPTKPNVDADLVALYVRADPNRFARLLARAESMADTAAAKGETAGSRLDVYRSEFAAGALDLTGFIADYSRLTAECSQHKARAERYRASIAAARSVLRRDAAALGLGDLRSGLREAAALSSREPDPILTQLTTELESVDADLTAIGLGLGDQADDDDGPITESLKARRDDLAERIKSRKRETAASTGANVGELIDKARDGDPAALASIAGTVRARRLVFRARLEDDLVDALADSLAESAGVFAELILM